MDDMPQTPTPAHAKPARRDHLWVLVVIAGFALYDVWEAWTQVGNKSGFAHGTGWTLTVIVEAFAGYVLWAWFNAPGVRSRRFAMWSAFGMLALSLAGQGSSHLTHGDATPPPLVVVFVSILPVITLALIAIIVHVRRLDRDEAEAAQQARNAAAQQTRQTSAEAARITELEGALETAQAEAQTARQAASEAQESAAQAARRIEVLERKLAAQKPARTRTKGSGAGRTKPPAKVPHAEPATEVPNDLDARTEALGIWLENPAISGRELAEKVGMKERWGQLRKNEFAASSAGPDSTPGPSGPA